MRRLAAALLLSCAAFSGRAFGQTDGRSLYLSKCSACHGRDGAGHTTVGQSLSVGDIRPSVKTMTDEQLRQLVLEGRGKMPANKKFDDDKVASLTLFLRDLAAGNPDTGRAVAQTQARPLDDVATVYQAKCSACHAQDGTGRTTIGKSLTVPDLTSAVVQGRGDPQLVEIISKGQGKMPAYSKSFNAVQIGQLVSYIRALPLGPSATTPRASPPASNPQAASPLPAAPTRNSTAASSASMPQPAKQPPSNPATKPAGAGPAVVPPVQKSPASAQQIYRAKCATCHSRDGSGTGTVGRSMQIPSLLSPEVLARSDEDLAMVITNGAGKMPAYKKKHTPAEIQLLVAYIRELAKK